MKILLIGNETRDTDLRASILAKNLKYKKNGLLAMPLPDTIDDGIYHTSVVDIHPGDLIKVSNNFDRIILADQNIKSYPHYKTFVTTVRFFIDLENNKTNVTFKENKNVQSYLQWKKFLTHNKSFCFYPFLALIDNWQDTTICPKNFVPIDKIGHTSEWQTNKKYIEIRNNMAQGIQMPERCHDCYDRENEGQESTRQFETLEWTQRLGLNSVDDFFKITNPVYYEIRPSSTCNIMCRTCDDFHSTLIEKEWKKINIPLVTEKLGNYRNTSFDIINFDTLERIYVGGGEPTIMPEFYSFLQKCIAQGKTSFELNIGTNGMFFSKKLISLLDNFTDVCFSFSYDGYGKVNDYIRWKSDFDTIVQNGRMLRDRGHKIALQTVFSMYSITRIHEVFEFFDQEYLGSGLLVQVAGGFDNIFMPYNHPRPDLVVQSMIQCQKTKIYYMNGRSIKSMVDLLLDYYSNPNYKCDPVMLEKFYSINDKLDISRKSNLIDYIPELAEARHLYNL